MWFVNTAIITPVTTLWSWWFMEKESSLVMLLQVHEYSISRSIVTFFIAIALVSYYTWLIKKLRNKNPPLPPGPRGLPLIGNLPFLDKDLHRCFAKLSKKYGPIMKLHLGTRLWIIISSPSVAKEFLKDNDIIFASRDNLAISLTGSYGGLDLVWTPYGQHWRMLRKLCVRELLSNARLDALYGLRRREVRSLVNQIFSSKKGKPINLAEDVLGVMFNIVTSMLWGGTLEEKERTRVAEEFRRALSKIVELLATPNISDFFPALAKFDLQGVEARTAKVRMWFDQLFEYIVEQRRKMRVDGELHSSHDKGDKDFLQVLLQVIDEGDHKTPFNFIHLKGLFLDMMGAGTETSSSTVEWAMAELMKKPEKLKKTQEEIEQVVGMNNVVEETHLPKLHYLNAVIKEVLRLHPVAPLLVPRRASESCILGGYMVPEGAKVMVNAWAIHRDPEYWDDPSEFKPERFLNNNNDGDSNLSRGEWDYNGNDFRYIPFGSGRRICVGIPMAERMIPYLLASLLHSFEWILPEGIEDVDLSDCFGLELKKKEPLTAIPVPRLSDPELYV